ncbi:hypothetical protein SGLAM104S_00184 [Streptomyces glaucescens]
MSLRVLELDRPERVKPARSHSPVGRRVLHLRPGVQPAVASGGPCLLDDGAGRPRGQPAPLELGQHRPSGSHTSRPATRAPRTRPSRRSRRRPRAPPGTSAPPPGPVPGICGPGGPASPRSPDRPGARSSPGRWSCAAARSRLHPTARAARRCRHAGHVRPRHRQRPGAHGAGPAPHRLSCGMPTAGLSSPTMLTELPHTFSSALTGIWTTLPDRTPGDLGHADGTGAAGTADAAAGLAGGGGGGGGQRQGGAGDDGRGDPRSDAHDSASFIRNEAMLHRFCAGGSPHRRRCSRTREAARDLKSNRRSISAWLRPMTSPAISAPARRSCIRSGPSCRPC